MMDRRTLLMAMSAGAGGLSASGAAARQGGDFPKDFLWGAATAGHQVEGNNVSSDAWLVEGVKPSLFVERSGDADNSLELWPSDLDLLRRFGLNSYRFSLEWARIEPEKGLFSLAMLDHYKRMVDGCRERGLTPVVTFNHCTTPRWFAAAGGWTSPEAAELFARFCDRAARHMAAGVGYASTLNEPNGALLLWALAPPQMRDVVRAMNAAAGRACGSTTFKNAIVAELADMPATQLNLMAAHKAGKAAIKAARGDLPVGVNLALRDEEAVGRPTTLRDSKRAEFYGAWLEIAKSDDFVGVQNYERAIWGPKGPLKPPPNAKRNSGGGEIYPPSLAGAVRYAHAATGAPVLITEHGLGTDDDSLRADFIRASLVDLQQAVVDGVPVKGYLHWSLLDNFEWVFGYARRYGLAAVDRETFRRTPKPSFAVLGEIARRNAV